MDAIGIIASMGRPFLSQIASHMHNQIKDSEDKMAVNQAVALGIFKSYGELVPELSEVSDSLSAFARDFETLQHAGFSNDAAHDIATFIYFPRTYLIQDNYLPEEFVIGLEPNQIELIVNNSLKEVLQSNGVAIDELEFEIAGMEGDEPFLEHLNNKSSIRKITSFLYARIPI